ncbi:MAG TPA: hypothetical protein VHO69_00025, partial [Phototrophicaceae bacterium]|nr:hypothetical protein [Phototrophicaceae bacterium]
MGTGLIEPNIQTNYTALNPGDLINAIRQNSSTKMRAVRVSLVILDFLSIGLAFLLAYNLRFITPTASFFDQTGVNDSAFYSQFVYVLIPLWLILFALFRLYDPTILFGGHQEYMNVFNGCTGGIMMVIVASYLDPTLMVARAWLLLSWGTAVTLVMVERFTMRRIVYTLRRRGHMMAPAYIVGANSEGIAIAEQLMSAPVAGVNIIGFLDDNIRPGEEVLPGLVVHGPTTRAEDLVARFGIERLIVATSGVQRDNLL